MVVSLMQTLKYDANDQTINIDDQKSDKAGSERHTKVTEMLSFHKKAYDYGTKNSSQLAAESIVNQLNPQFLQIINSQINLDVSLDQLYEQLYDQYFQNQQEKNAELQIYLENEFENLYQKKLIELEKNFKFKFDQQQKSQMKQDLIEATLNCQSFQYFQNILFKSIKLRFLQNERDLSKDCYDRIIQ